MNLTRAQKVRLGVFMMSGIAVMVLVLLTLAGLKLWEPRTYYRARFTDSVGGLERSAPVKYQGLRIGRVETMQIAADDPSAIEVLFSVEPSAVLYEGTKALLDSSGLTGLKTINLTPGDPHKPRLKPNSILPTGASGLDRIADLAGAIVADIKKVTDQLGNWANDDNRKRVESLIVNLDSFVGHLDEQMVNAEEPIADAVREVTHTAQAVTELANEGTKTLFNIRQTIDGTQQEIIRTLQAVQRPIRDVDPKEVAGTVTAIRVAATRMGDRLGAEETGRAIASFGDTITRINRLIQDVDLVVRAGREDFTESLSYLRQAAEDLREFSRILAQNPSVLVRGREESGQ